VFLIGPRRYGKTSILKAAEDKLRVANSVVLRLDAESYPTLEMLVNGIVAGAAKQLKSGVEQAGEQITKFFSRLRPELDFGLSDSAWTAKVSMGSGSEEQGGVTLLVEALNGLESLAKAQPPGRAVGLVILCAQIVPRLCIFCLLWLVWHNMESATYVLSAKGRRTNPSSSAINLAYNVQRSPLSPFQLKSPAGQSLAGQ
jgi:hypothetical protein